MRNVKKRRKNKYVSPAKEFTKSKEIILTENDRIIYSYKQNVEGKYTEVVTATYLAQVNNEWITIVRYDSTHGYLHRHTRVLLSNELETTDTRGVKRKGNHHVWLTWALNDLRRRFAEYRRLIFKRSKTVDNYS